MYIYNYRLAKSLLALCACTHIRDDSLSTFNYSTVFCTCQSVGMSITDLVVVQTVLIVYISGILLG